MGKERGRYKRYIFDKNAKIPRQTVQNQAKDLESYSITAKESNQIQSSLFETNIFEELAQTNYEEDILTNSEDLVTEIEIPNEPILNDVESLLDNGDNNEQDDFEEDFDSEFSSLCSSEELTKEEIAAAYLAAFYNGRTSQSSLGDYLKLSNIFSPIKLPTTFDGLKNLIKGKARDLEFKKSWYCGTCVKTIKLDPKANRLQRSL